MSQNPYSAIDLNLPADVHAIKDSLVETAGAGGNSAFKRQIDLWWMCLLIGVREGVRVKATTVGPLVKFNTGVVLDSDAWRIVHIELIAMAAEGSNVLTEPNRVMSVAAEYAYGGASWILKHLGNQPSPLTELSRLVNEFLDQAGPAAT